MWKKWLETGKKAAAVVLSAALIAGTATVGYADTAAGPGANLKQTNGVTIYISKRGQSITLKQNGVEIGTYPASVGSLSDLGDKEVEGDKRTPSGDFYVCTKNDKSAYHLALGVSYPAIPDAERGFEAGIISEEERDAIISANKAVEQPPWNTALGGFIEIHGNRRPGKGTLGCISVDNSVMDLLWEYCNLGVPITIGP